MTYSEIDWFFTWKLFHWEFCWIYLALSVPIRFILVKGINRTSVRSKTLYVATSSVTLSLASTWFPVLPIIAGAFLAVTTRRFRSESLLISVPLLAVSLAIETSLIDAALFRVLLKQTVKQRLAMVFVANAVNAAIALTLGLIWAIHHMPVIEAALH